MKLNNYINNLSIIRNSYNITGNSIMLKYKLISICDRGKRIDYMYTKPDNYWKTSTLWFIKSRYTKKELELIDDLFNNLDEGNLAIIKGILHNKTIKKL